MKKGITSVTLYIPINGTDKFNAVIAALNVKIPPHTIIGVAIRSITIEHGKVDYKLIQNKLGAKEGTLLEVSIPYRAYKLLGVYNSIVEHFKKSS